MKRTKIVCTIGPASEKRDILRQMIQSGMNVARLNFSHGTQAEHLSRLQSIRQIAQELDIPIPIIADLCGPKLRIGKIHTPVELNSGASFILTSERIEGDRNRVSISYPTLPEYIHINDRILLDDGNIELEVTKVTKTEIHCKVIHGGILSSNKGLSVVSDTISIPAITEKDKSDLSFAIQHQVDYIALSFVQSIEDIKQLKDLILAQNADVPIIAKIEKPNAVKNIDSILEIADGIMVARGDLGIEMPFQEVPIIQKTIIQKCNMRAKPVITATQMLESMVHKPRPTRAEVTDIANAILDGTDAVMLSGETAVGEYPVECVRTMAEIAQRTEKSLTTIMPDIAECQGMSLAEKLKNQRTGQLEYKKVEWEVAESVSSAVFNLANQLQAAAIVTPTESGSTARLIARFRPTCPIIALTPNRKTLYRLGLVWGVNAYFCENLPDTDAVFAKAEQLVQSLGLAKSGNTIIITAGIPLRKPGTTNLIRILTV
ncbi:MAG: pyruvate kinase [bacterium]|nr:pyruvate kinase [bacterium]